MKKITLLFILLIFLSAKRNDGYQVTDKLTVIEKFVNYNVITIKKGEMDFRVSETKPESSDFYINSNFFTSEDVIGLVVIDGKRKSKRVKGGGFFYVKNGKPYVKSKACPTITEYSSQTILWGIDNGKTNENLFRKKHAKLKRYRTLMGQTKNGDIIVVSSNRMGLVTIEEIVKFSTKFNIVDGILLDGGTSVDYKFKDNSQTVSFMSVPLGLKSPLDIKEPTTYICGNFN